MKKADAISGNDILEQSEEEILSFLDDAPDEELLRLIELRYEHEDKLLAAVTAGDMASALEMDFAGYYGIRERYRISLKTEKSAMHTFNTLLRKAVQKASVHPAHIDHVSAMFSRQIDCAGTTELLYGLYRDMIRKYCLLVQNYSLRGYSANVQNALNYIDFHLTEPLTLSYVAEKIAVSRKYLSSQFKKEYGCGITDYINDKRIRESLQYLALTTLPVQEVAERVGILDVNYYSRIFRRSMNMTPSAYRSMMRA